MNGDNSENLSRRNIQPRWTWAQAGHVAGLLLGGGLCLSLGLFAIGNTKSEAVVVHRGPAILGTKMQGVQTSVYEGDRLKTRLSAGELKVTQPRVLGPIRIGFLRGLLASDVTVESVEGNSATTGNAGRSGVDTVRAITSLVPKLARDTVVRADLTRLRLFERRNGTSTAVLDAERCWASARRDRLICRDGSLRGGAGDTTFKEAVYDERSWKITAHE